MKPTFRVWFAALVVCSALFNSRAVKGNCFEDFIASNPDATELNCCQTPGVETTIPASITQLTKLTSIDFRKPKFCSGHSGTFPTEGWDKLVHLEQLYMRPYKMKAYDPDASTVAVPTTLNLSNLPSLTALHLVNMKTTGEIPEWLLTMANLEQLSLEFCNITGAVPLSLRRLPNLLEIILVNNPLTGPIPEWFIDYFPELQLLVADRSDQVDFQQGLTGTIPRSIGSMSKLSILSLYNNYITGTLQSELGALTELTSFSAAANPITGTIPSSFGKLVKMHKLDFSRNSQLTGSLPAELSALTALHIVNYIGSRLYGPLPDFSVAVNNNFLVLPKLSHLAPGEDCSGPGDETMCSWGDDKCDAGICRGRTDAPTGIATAAPTNNPVTTNMPTTSSPVTTNMPTTKVASKTGGATVDDYISAFVGVGAGTLAAGLVNTLFRKARSKSGASDNPQFDGVQGRV